MEGGLCTIDLILHYQGIDILSKDFNMAFGRLVVPFLKLSLVILFVTSFSSIVRLWSQLNILSILMLFIMVIGSSTTVIPASIMMSSLFDKSTQFQRNTSTAFVDRIPDRKEKKILRGHLKACPVIRCQVGNLYHMEAKAKLTLLHHAVNGMVYMLVNVKM